MISKKEFKDNYFYKTELIKICRELGLPTNGTKVDLNSYLLNYFAGNKVSNNKTHTNVKSIVNYNDIQLSTKLIGSGFKFNLAAREFFAKYYNVNKFSFNKIMGVIKRRVEKDNNLDYTVGDLIQEYELVKSGKLKIDNLDTERTYQWNNFVRDFCKDPKTDIFKNKISVAAILWNKVKKLPGDKKYYSELLKYL